MRNSKVLLLILAAAMMFTLFACAPTPCDVHVDADEDSICDVCREAMCSHVDLNGDEVCEFCGSTLEHLTCVDNNSDGKCDKCEKCLTHKDTDNDNKCDNCSECIYHRKDDAMDGTCDDCGKQYALTTIAEAKAIATKLADGAVTPVRYYIYAKVDSVSKPAYGGMYLEDETGSMSVYGTYSADGSIGYAAFESKPEKGDMVLVACVLKNFGGSYEINNARLIAYEDVELDLTKYDEMTLAEAREADKGTLIKTSGTVARITYANGMIPQGFILYNNGVSIYVYDVDAAHKVAIGNNVTVAAEKDYWILDAETNNASKFGYLGCNQLADAYVVTNDGATGDVDMSAAEASTVKEIMDTPVTEDISTLVYKVNALVVKKQEPGFVNYYIYDIDGTTGSYVYTQCNGSDFAWLDEFDGKICTVYLTALNAKSTNAGCLWRLLPVKVVDEGYTFDLAGVNDFVLTYHALSQFLTRYTGNPNTALISTVDSALLGFEGATVTYTSNNESVVSFATVDGVVHLTCGENGTAEITVTSTYNGVSKSATVEITVAEPTIEDALGVDEAINSEVGSEITVTGIVGTSLVNKVGFYLVDENGIIAVQATSEFMKSVSIGDQIIIKGTRATNEDATMIYIDSPTLVANLYGDNDYSVKSFIKDKTLEEIFKTTDTAQGYVVEATVKMVGSQYFTNYYLTVDGVDYLIYSSNGKGLEFLENFVGQTITADISICNWNGKGNRLVVHAVYVDDGKVVNDNCFTY